MKIVINTAILLFSTCTALAQTAESLGIVLTGGRGGGACILSREGKRIPSRSLRMVFTNKGREPVIIVNPTLGYGTGLRKVIVYYPAQDDCKGGSEPYGPCKKLSPAEGARRTIPIDPIAAENFQAMATLFEDDKPPANMTVVLNSEESFTFEECVQIKDENKLTQERFIEWKNPDTGKVERFQQPDWTPIGYRLTYEFSFLPLSSDPDFLEHLASKWRRFGRLPVGPGGTYTITSELIRF